jgi:hypothetical protein
MQSVHSATPQKKRSWELYTPTSTEFKMSRSKLELFMSCSRCFYLDRRCGIKRPEGWSLTLYNAVDILLKREFDIYRAAQKPHPVLIRNNIYAVPYAHPMLAKWRDPYKGIQYAIPNTNILLTGAVDDLWFDLKTGEIIVVDYKATSWNGAISIAAAWQGGNKRQLEIHQWLLRKNDLEVSKTAYLLYCNGRSDADFFNDQLKFETSLIPYLAESDGSWIEETVVWAYECLRSDMAPDANKDCKYCSYAFESGLIYRKKDKFSERVENS